MTIQLVRDQQKSFVLTLNETRSESLPNNWLFVFTKLQGNKEYKLYLTDISAFPDRYNKFTIDEGTTVDFVNTGEHEYKVYQMPDGGSTDETLGVLVENGLMILTETVTADNEFNTDITNTVYE